MLPTGGEPKLKYWKLNVQKATAFNPDKDGNTKPQDMSEALNRGPFYFAADEDGHLINNWFSPADIPHMILLKWEIARAFHHHLSAESMQMLGTRPVWNSVPHVEHGGSHVHLSKAMKQDGHLFIQSKQLHSGSALTDQHSLGHGIFKPKLYHSTSALTQLTDSESPVVTNATSYENVTSGEMKKEDMPDCTRIEDGECLQGNNVGLASFKLDTQSKKTLKLLCSYTHKGGEHGSPPPPKITHFAQRICSNP